MSNPRKKQLKTTFYDVLIIPEHESTSKTFKIKKVWIRTLISFVIMIVLGISYLIYMNKDLIDKGMKYDHLYQENIRLEAANDKVKEIFADLEQLKTFRERTIRSLANTNQIDNLQGGTSVPDSVINQFNRTTEDEEKFFNAYEVINETVPSISPIDNATVSRRFEYSNSQRSGHLGIDLVSKEGALVKASAAGIVIFSDWTANYGNTIIIKHAHKYMTIYKHNKSNRVVSGQSVRKGDVIAYLGSTGKITTGAHLHFEVWHNSVPVDPETFVFDFK